MKTRFGRSAVTVLALLILLSLAVSPSFADNVPNLVPLNVLYSNGSINGGISAYSVSPLGQYNVANSFTLAGTSTITSFDAGLWVASGDAPTTVSWYIETAPSFNGGSVLFSGSGTFSNSSWGTAYGGAFDIYTSTLSGLSGVSLGAGTYYLELYNVSTSQTQNVFWDENDGPSQAYMNALGKIGSEAFTIYGTTSVTATPEPGTIVMFGTGILGLAGAVRRRFCV